MSLVGTLGDLLDLAAVAAVIGWILSIKFTGGAHRRLWREATADLRREGRYYPLAALGMGWLVALILAGALRAGTALLALFIAFPVILLVEGWATMGGFAVFGRARAAITASGDDPATAEDVFRLPVDVRQSKASDVSKWTSDAVPIPRRSLLTLGASGSGKSETLKHFVDQLRADPNEPVVVFDMKTDYQDFLESRGASMIRLSAEGSETEIGSPVRWNLFAELESEADADEIARSLFPDPSDGDQFFSTAGRQLFAATVKYLHREIEDPSNQDLKRYWQRTDPETMHKDLRSDGHEDLVSAAAAIDPDAGRQASGVYATAQQQVNDLLVGDFGERGSFSIREYMANPQGRVLVLDYPSRQAESIAPLFRFLLDRSISEGMADPGREAFYLLDEIEHMNVPLQRLGELINVGRGNNCQAIISLQSVAQLYDTYSENRGKALLSGMATSIILRLGDDESIDFARSVIGTSFSEYTAHESKQSGPHGVSMTTSKETKLEEEHDFAEGDFLRFDPGEAVIARQGTGYVHGRIEMLEQ